MFLVPMFIEIYWKSETSSYKRTNEVENNFQP